MRHKCFYAGHQGVTVFRLMFSSTPIRHAKWVQIMIEKKIYLTIINVIILSIIRIIFQKMILRWQFVKIITKHMLKIQLQIYFPIEFYTKFPLLKICNKIYVHFEMNFSVTLIYRFSAPHKLLLLITFWMIYLQTRL